MLIKSKKIVLYEAIKREVLDDFKNQYRTFHVFCFLNFGTNCMG